MRPKKEKLVLDDESELSIFLLALAGMVGGALGFFPDFLWLQDSDYFGSLARFSAGVGIGFSLWHYLKLPASRLPGFLIGIPAFWFLVERLCEWLIVKKQLIMRICQEAGMAGDQLASAYANVSMLFPFVMLAISGVWLAIALAFLFRPLRKKIVWLLISGGAGGVVAIASSVVLIPVFTIGLEVLSRIVESGSSSPETLFKAIQIVFNALAAGFQMYCLNLFLLIPLKLGHFEEESDLIEST